MRTPSRLFQSLAPYPKKGHEKGQTKRLRDRAGERPGPCRENARRQVLALLAAAMVCHATSAQVDAADREPLSSFRSQTTFALVGGAQTVLSSRSEEANWEFVASAQLSNFWGEFERGGDPEAMVDFEALTSDLRLIGSPHPHLQLGLAYSQRDHLGGFLDGLILGFHRIAGLDLDGRELVQRDQIRLAFNPDDDRPHQDRTADARGNFERSLTGSAVYVLNPTADTRVAFSISLANHWGDGPLVERDSIDGTAGFFLGTAFGDTRLDFLAEVARTGATSIGPIAVRRWQPRLTLAMARPGPEALGRETDWLVTYRGARGPLDSFAAWSEPSHEVLLGMRFHGPRLDVEVGLIETVLNFSNAADLGFHIAWRRKLGGR